MSIFFFFNDTATTEIYTLSLHDALPIFNNACTDDTDSVIASFGDRLRLRRIFESTAGLSPARNRAIREVRGKRSEEHTSELQSQSNLVCRLLLEKKKQSCMIDNHFHQRG